MEPGAWGLGVVGGIALASAAAALWIRRLGYSTWIAVDIGLVALLGASAAAAVHARWFVQLPLEVLASLVVAERRGMPWRRILDVFAAVVGAGQLLGRLGCWFAGCCYGRPAAWGLLPPTPPPGLPPGARVVPLPLIEGGLDLALSVAASALLLRAPAPGRVAAAWFVGHGAMRFALDFHRADLPRGAWGLTAPQLGALAAIAVGLALGATGRSADAPRRG